MEVTLAQLAAIVRGAVVGNARTRISAAATLGDARPGVITFIDSIEKAGKLLQSPASAAVTPRDFVLPKDVATREISLLQVDDVPAAFARIVTMFRPPRRQTRHGVSPHAVVSPSAKLGPDVDVHAGATIDDDVEIGAGSTIHAGVRILAGCKVGQCVTIYPNVVLYENTIIGDRVTIHAGAVLGAHGFGYKVIQGKHKLSAQLGWVEIGCDVDIGANTTIDRGTYGATVIGEGTKIDNQVMIAHNCRLGRHNLICSQVGIAGSSTTGDYVIMAGQAGVRDHVHIGDRALLGAKAGIHNDVPDGVSMLGCPATPLKEQRLMMGAYAKLPEMRRHMKELKAAIEALQRQIALPALAADSLATEERPAAA
jgi:UDP-3-O-[3-hydroxymyristoyl] glucosamine N-acyltransferase